MEASRLARARGDWVGIVPDASPSVLSTSAEAKWGDPEIEAGLRGAGNVGGEERSTSGAFRGVDDGGSVRVEELKAANTRFDDGPAAEVRELDSAPSLRNRSRAAWISASVSTSLWDASSSTRDSRQLVLLAEKRSSNVVEGDANLLAEAVAVDGGGGANRIAVNGESLSSATALERP